MGKDKQKEDKMTYAYIRVSTIKQDEKRQIMEIRKVAPEALLIIDKFSGSTMERPGWLRLIKLAKEGRVKTIYMDELSRMGRNREDGFAQWMMLYEMGIELRFLKTEHVNTSTYKESVGRTLKMEINTSDNATNEFIQSIVNGLNKYICELAKRQIYIAFDEAATEREYLSKRTSEGMKVAALEGKQIGRRKGSKITTKKKIKAKRKIKRLYKEFGGSLTATECMRVCQISKQSFYTYVSEIIKESEPITNELETIRQV